MTGRFRYGRVLGKLSLSTPRELSPNAALFEKLGRPYHFLFKIKFYAIDEFDQEPGFFPQFKVHCSFTRGSFFDIIVGNPIASNNGTVAFEVALCEEVQGEGGTLTEYTLGILQVPQRLVVPEWRGVRCPTLRRGQITLEMEIEEWGPIPTREDVVAHFPTDHRVPVIHIWDHVNGVMADVD